MFEKGFLQKISIKQGVQMVGMIFKHALKYNRKAEVLFKTGWRKLKISIFCVCICCKMEGICQIRSWIIF